MTARTANDQRFREFKMPDVGEGLTEAEILKWYVAAGDTVTDGQVVCEVETAKAAVELPIPFDGVVHELRFPEGTTVDVGQVIISVDTQPGAAPAAPEAVPAAAAAPEEPEEPQGRQAVLVGYGAAPSSTKRRARKQQPVPAQPVAAAIQAELNGSAAVAPAAAPAEKAAPAGQAPQASVGARPLAKPPVRKLAKDLGVDLAAVIPSGADGIVTREDVHAAASAATAPVAEEPVAVAGAPAAGADLAARETRIPVKGVRKATAQAMVASAFTAPHVTEFITVDVTRTMKLVQKLKADPDMAGLRVNPLLLVAKAFLVAIK
ncbi:biotin/lipoyl-containing protein, partial [Streptomyces roseoverticillatus]|uniref:biotin/lipoyl-containing protein n=1 Tax=Streptomyces roseoverticillatus TaxID=66429 RepID=UPI003404D6C3